jgi:hypothetical protein
MPNFLSYICLCVSSADVDFWVNGGWDQPDCPVAVNVLDPVVSLISPGSESKICNFKAFRFLKLYFKSLKQFKLKHNFILPHSAVKYQRNSNFAFPKNSFPNLASYQSSFSTSLYLKILENQSNLIHW